MGTMRGGAMVVQQAVGGARHEARQCTVARPSVARAGVKRAAGAEGARGVARPSGAQAAITG